MAQFKKVLSQILLIFITIFLITNCSNNAPVPSLHDEQGNAIKLSHLKGKWVIINYWAPWCSDCQYEIPELNNFFQNNKNQNVVLLGVDFDQVPAEDLKDIVQRANVKFPVLAENPAQMFNLDNVDFLPTTFIISPEGKMVKKIVGHTTEQALLEYTKTPA